MNRMKTKQILITVGALVAFEVLRYTPLIRVNYHDYFSMLNYHSILRLQVDTANDLGKASVLGLGWMPYISANLIVMLLLSAFFSKKPNKPKLDSVTLKRTTLFVTLLIAVVNSCIYALLILKVPYFYKSLPVSLPPNVFIVLTIATQTAAVFLAIWLGMLITKRGVGHGISLLFLVPLIETVLRGLSRTQAHIEKLQGDRVPFILFFGIVIALAWFITHALEYDQKVHVRLDNDQNKTGTLHIPLSLTGILPIYFAVSMLKFPAQLVAFNPPTTHSWLAHMTDLSLHTRNIGNWVVLMVLVVFFTYFAFALFGLDLKSVGRLDKVGLRIPGVERGKPTLKYLDRVCTQTVILWAAFLMAVTFAMHVLGLMGWQLRGRDLIVLVGICLAVWKSCVPPKSQQKAVYCHNDIGEVLIVKALLECHGVEAIIDDTEALGKLFPITIGQLGSKRIMVAEASYVKAKEIVSNAL